MSINLNDIKEVYAGEESIKSIWLNNEKIWEKEENNE